MVYEFKDEGTGELVEIDFSPERVPSIGDSISYKGRLLTRIASRFMWGWNSQHAPRNDEDRKLAQMMFQAPNPANPGGVSDEQLVKNGEAVTADMKKSNFTTGTI